MVQRQKLVELCPRSEKRLMGVIGWGFTYDGGVGHNRGISLVSPVSETAPWDDARAAGAYHDVGDVRENMGGFFGVDGREQLKQSVRARACLKYKSSGGGEWGR